MFNIFKKKSTKEQIEPAEPITVLEPVEKWDMPVKAITELSETDKIILEIHESFYTEVDSLLAQAKISRSLETTKSELIAKSARLKSLGFTSTKEVLEADVELARLKILENENKNKASLIRAIDYFYFHYPQYKFITEESVKKICNKYNLIYGPVHKYTGTVPDQNLKHIENFKIKESDKAFVEETFSRFDGKIISRVFFDKKCVDQIRERRFGDYYISRMTRETLTECPLTIAAPAIDFNMDKSELKDFEISDIWIPDPIVLAPVYFENQRHFLVVTAWGIEAKDPEVINPKMN